MGGIQGAINSMISSGSRAIMAVKGYQALKTKQAAAAERTAAKKAKAEQQSVQVASAQQLAAQRAKQSMMDAIEAKRNQRRNFMDYLKRQPSSIGLIGELDPELQKKIAAQYTPAMRQRLMDSADKERANGKHK